MPKTVAIYHRSVPNQKNQEKVMLLKNFAHGVKLAGDTVLEVETFTDFPKSNVAMIQGWITDVNTRPHLRLRRDVIDRQRKRGQHVLTADSNLFLYTNTANPLHYLRYSFDGVFPNTGIYCDANPEPHRWRRISRDLDITVKDWRTAGNHILLCMQRRGGWSMGNLDPVEWAADVILQLRNHTDRPIVIRPHPGDKKARSYVGDINTTPLLTNVSISPSNHTLSDDLRGCWAAVNHNSSPLVGAAIEGIPVFVTDPDKSVCRQVANTDFAMIENPALPERQAWLERLAMFHWNFEELSNGTAWQHMRQFI